MFNDAWSWRVMKDLLDDSRSERPKRWNPIALNLTSQFSDCGSLHAAVIESFTILHFLLVVKIMIQFYDSTTEGKVTLKIVFFSDLVKKLARNLSKLIIKTK